MIGARIGYIAPHIGSALSSFAGQKFTFGAGLSISSSGVALSAGFTITGAQVLTVTGALVASGLLMFAKGNGPRMGHNQYENKQFNSLCNKYRLTKDQRRILHDYISGQNLSYHEIEKAIIDLFFS